jgi:osmoprotectant transport system permease protein
VDLGAFLRSNGPLLIEGLVDHIVLTVLAVTVGFAISFGLALLVRRDRRWLPPLAGTAGVLYTIPSLALFVMLIPITGLSLLTAEIGLVSYTLLILLRNFVAGLDSVPPDVIESADGMGYASLQRLWRVELPIALPLVIAGVRIATVTTIGLVMVSYVVGEGGLGQVMLRAFQLQNWPLVYASFAGMVGLAILADAILLIILRLLTPWSRAAARS